MKVSAVIKYLKAVEKQCGDVEVLLSSDSEGNSFGSLHGNSFCPSDSVNALILFPWEESDDITELVKE